MILAALKEKLDEPLVVPPGIVTQDVDAISGYAAHDGFEVKKEYFIKGTEPSGEDPIHKKIRDCNGDQKKHFFQRKRSVYARWKQ